MNEPNKGLLTPEKAKELVQRALENRDALAACKGHEFFPIVDEAGDHYGYYRCAHCSGEVNGNTYTIYLQGVRDGAGLYQQGADGESK